eukprot:scaffold208627_cov33-Tisochrysis_lutea.AAC.1
MTPDGRSPHGPCHCVALPHRHAAARCRPRPHQSGGYVAAHGCACAARPPRSACAHRVRRGGSSCEAAWVHTAHTPS